MKLKVAVQPCVRSRRCSLTPPPPAVLTVFSTTAEGAVQYIDNAPADLFCTALGADINDFGYEVFWYVQVS